MILYFLVTHYFHYSETRLAMTNDHYLTVNQKVVIHYSISFTFLDSIYVHPAILESTVGFTYSKSVDCQGRKG